MHTFDASIGSRADAVKAPLPKRPEHRTRWLTAASIECQNGTRYDVIFDAVGQHSFRRSRRSLKRGGSYLETDLGFMFHVPLLVLATKWIGDKKVKLGLTRYKKEDVALLKELIEAGQYHAVIDRRYPLEDVVEAVRYVEAGHKTGNVILTVNRDPGS